MLTTAILTRLAVALILFGSVGAPALLIG